LLFKVLNYFNELIEAEGAEKAPCPPRGKQVTAAEINGQTLQPENRNYCEKSN
jgi:hypothetical protein